MSGVNYYELFSLPTNVTPADLRQRYRTLSLTHHPDRGGSTEQMAELNQAYRVLSNPLLRHEYDQKLLQHQEEFNGGYRMTTYTAPVARAAADDRILPNTWMRFAFAITLGLAILAYSIMNNIILPTYVHEARSTATPPSAVEVTEPRETNLSDVAEDAASKIPHR